MVYKKYIKRGGKIFGPYYYESYRDKDGKARKRYIGTIYKKERRSLGNHVGQLVQNKRLLLIIFLAIFLLASFFVLTNRSLKISGMTFDGEVVDLEIKDPANILGTSLADDENEIMEFELPEGKLLLYFDLIDYHEVVKTIDIQIEENEIEEPEADEEINESEESEENIEHEEELPVINNEKTEQNETIGPQQSTGNESVVKQKENETATEESKTVEETNEEQEEESNEKDSEKVEKREEKETKKEEKEEELSEEEPAEGDTITGGSIEENPEERELENALEKVKSKAEKMDEEEIEDIVKEKVVPADNFDIIVNKSELDNKEFYKWSYKIALNDLKFMAKIKVTSEEEISLIDENTLKIGNQLLSFSDLAEQGYKISFGKPGFEMISEELEAESKKNETVEEIAEPESVEENESLIEEGNETPEETEEEQNEKK
jgi:hypothetical protein